MVFENIVVAQDTLLIIGSYLLLTGSLVYFYRFSNRRLLKRIKELKRKDQEMYRLLEKVNHSRAREHNALKRRIEELEKSVEVLLKPESPEKELEKERVVARK